MAATCSAPTATYKTHGRVTILDQTGKLSFIRTERDDEFWVPTDKLKIDGPRKVAKREQEAATKRFVEWIDDNNPDANRLLGYVLENGALVVELTPETDCTFDAEYHTATGCCCPVVNNRSVVMVTNPNRWGIEYRVTFPTPPFALPELGFSYQRMFAGGAGRLTINSKAIFWHMVAWGMRLGD